MIDWRTGLWPTVLLQEYHTVDPAELTVWAVGDDGWTVTTKDGRLGGRVSLCWQAELERAGVLASRWPEDRPARNGSVAP